MNNTVIPYYSQARHEMVAYLPSRATRILEVGCGTGGFGLLLKQNYPDAQLYGIENNPLVAAEASKVYKHVWISDVCSALESAEGEVFDLIVFNDVLEHIVDPWKCLSLAKTRLSSDGAVVASIPNMRFWPILSDLVFQGAWTYRDAGVMDRTHLRFFTKKSMVNLFENSGYRIIKIEGINKTWKKSLRWKALNILFAGLFSDCLFPQFAVVANPDEGAEVPHSADNNVT